MPNGFLFVYGTLRKEAAAPMSNALSKHCEYVSEGLIRGKLYEVDGYPGAIESSRPEDIVRGELYRINNHEVLRQLDEYEECSEQFPQPHEYERKLLSVILPEGEAIQAWVYIYNHDVSQLTRIKHGDYLLYLKEHQNRD